MKYNVIETYKYKDLERFTYAQLESEEIAIDKYPLILYDPFEVEFDHHGIAVLESALNPTIVQELNGDYSLSAEIVKDQRGKYTRIKPLCIIKAQGQLFRIPFWEGVKDNGFTIKINAKHISYDAAEIFTEDRRVNNQNVYETLSRLLEGDTKGKYSLGVTDLATTASANFINENFIESLFNKIIPRWNGELARDNFKFTVKQRLGEYKPNLFIRYGKNSTSINRKVDYSNLCTKILPVGKNGITIEEINRGIKYITSSKINDYPLVYTRKIKFDDAETPEQLKELATEYLNKYDKPLVTVEVNLIDLEQNEAYDNLKSAIRMNLGDTVTIYDEDLDIDEEQRVISLEIDAVTGVKLKITLGEFAPSFADSVSDLEETTNEIADKISENIQTSDDIKNQVVNNTTEIEGLKSVTENLNKDITSTNKEIGQLPALETEYKDDLVGAINELKNVIDYDPGEGEEEKIGLKQEVESLKLKVKDLEENLKVITEILVNEGLYPES